MIDQPANEEQLRFLLSLYRQRGITPPPIDDLAALTKWQAAKRISALRGYRSPEPEELDATLASIAAARAEAIGEKPNESQAHQPRNSKNVGDR